MKRTLGLLFAVSLLLGGCAAKSADQAAAPSPSPFAHAGAVALGVEGRAQPRRLGAHHPAVRGAEDHRAARADRRLLRAHHHRTDPARGCLRRLVTDKVVWLLIGPPAAGLRAGQKVKVTGLPDPGFESQCTGSPFKVTTVTPA